MISNFTKGRRGQYSEKIVDSVLDSELDSELEAALKNRFLEKL